MKSTDDWETRLENLENLVSRGHFEDTNSIEDFINDEEPLIRAEVAESLQCYQYEQAQPLLLNLIHDDDPLVRAKSVATLGRFGDIELVARFQQMLKQEKTPEVLLHLNAALYRLTKNEKYLKQLAGFLATTDGGDRIAASNELKVLINNINISFVYSKVKEQYLTETAYGILENLWRVLRILERYDRLILKKQYKITLNGLTKPQK